jgi:hypothetical protein
MLQAINYNNRNMNTALLSFNLVSVNWINKVNAKGQDRTPHMGQERANDLAPIGFAP